jgi:hypothetical protein
MAVCHATGHEMAVCQAKGREMAVCLAKGRHPPDFGQVPAAAFGSAKQCSVKSMQFAW